MVRLRWISRLRVASSSWISEGSPARRLMTLELGERIVWIRDLKILSVICGIGEGHGNYYNLSVTDPNSVLCLFVESCSMSEHQVVIICPHCPALPAHSSGDYHRRKVLEDTSLGYLG